MLPELPSWLPDFAWLLLRAMLAVIFFSSGSSHVAQPKERGKQIDLSAPFTLLLGSVEILAALSVAFGILPRAGALLLMLVMAGAMYMKIVRWNTGFYEEKGYGWHYDLLLFAGAFTVFASGGGNWTLLGEP